MTASSVAYAVVVAFTYIFTVGSDAGVQKRCGGDDGVVCVVSCRGCCFSGCCCDDGAVVLFRWCGVVIVSCRLPCLVPFLWFLSFYKQEQPSMCYK